MREECVDDVAFLIDRPGQSIYALNAVGYVIWQALVEPLAVSDVTELLGGAFPETPREQISADVRRVFKSFVENDLIREYH